MKKLKNTIVAILFFGVLLYLLRFRIMDVCSRIFYGDYVLDELTEEEKVEDFEQFYTTIVESVPYLDEVEEMYGIDFVARKAYYLEQIKATDDNVEFYGVMAAISEDLASFHTDVCFPWYSYLQGLGCYNQREVLHQFGMEKRITEWYNAIREDTLANDDVNMFSVVYVDGKYILREGVLSDEHKDLANCEVVSVDGMPAGQYFVNHISVYDLKYDAVREQPYRTMFAFNDSIGEQVTVVLKDAAGNEIEKTMYSDKGLEIVAAYGYMFNDKFNYYKKDTSNEVVTYRDDVNQLEYVQINSCNRASGQEVKEYLENAVYDKIVIDLRENSGGYPQYGRDYIYPALYSEDVQFDTNWIVPKTKQNEDMTDLLSVKIAYYDYQDEDYFYYINSVKYKGEAEKQKEVYYLIGPGTGSAADGYIAMIQENDLGVVVGENTGGEGLCASFICQCMPNSSLVYIYYPSQSCIDGQKYNACAGTAPDVYITQSTEGYALYETMRIEGTAEEYEARLQYDTVLKWVIEQK